LPTYSYKCTECGTAFDIQQAFTDNTLTECPNCGGKLRKIFTAVGVSFTGSGFYRNDSRATTKSSEKGGSSTSSETKSSESKSSESKSSESKSSESKSSDSKPSSSKPAPAAASTPAASPSKTAG
jgi:putative FmdB family regulatory protein